MANASPVKFGNANSGGTRDDALFLKVLRKLFDFRETILAVVSYFSHVQQTVNNLVIHSVVRF